MTRLIAATVCIVAAVSLAGCASHKDANMCDFYQGLGVDYTHSQGFVPSDVQDEINKFC